MSLEPGDYKIKGDPSIAAMRVNGDDSLALKGHDGRYDTREVIKLSPCQLHDNASYNATNDATLKETFDTHEQNRKPRWTK